jgi:hypothetical protein
VIYLIQRSKGSKIEMFDGAFPEMQEVINKFECIDVSQFLSHSQTLYSNLQMKSEVSIRVYISTVFALISFRRFPL